MMIETWASNDDPAEELNAEPFPNDMEYEASQEESSEMVVDEDPPWTPEETDRAYVKTGGDDDKEEFEKLR